MKISRLFSVFIASAIILSPLASIKADASTTYVTINDINFPDSHFRQYVSENFDLDNNNELNYTELMLADEVSFYNIYYEDDEICSLKGIEYFTNLTTVSVSLCTTITDLDLSQCTKLKELYLGAIDELDISNNVLLTMLNIEQLDSGVIDISNNPFLKIAYEEGNFSRSDLTWDNKVFAIYEYPILEYESYRLLINENITVINNQPSDNSILSGRAVNINETNFPDPMFRNYILENIDKDNDGKLSQLEILQCYSISISRRSADDPYLHDLKGIEFFTELESLRCGNSANLDYLDLSHNTMLRSLDISSDSIHLIDISNNPLLIDAYLQGEVTHPTSTHYLYFNDNLIDTYEVTEVRYTYNNCTLDLSSYTMPVVTSPEEMLLNGTSSFCERLYTCALDREYDPDGKAYWVSAIGSGTSAASAAESFIFSEEFINSNLSDRDYVVRLYKTFMDRMPSADEISYWCDQLSSSMTRHDVFSGFTNSSEWINICYLYGIPSGTDSNLVDSGLPVRDRVMRFAVRMYTTCLNREVDVEGLMYWTDSLVSGNTSGSQLARFFFQSEEFTNAHHSNTEYLYRLYRTFMGREPSADELQYWLEELSSGKSREEVLEGFAYSWEFETVCTFSGIEI